MKNYHEWLISHLKSTQDCIDYLKAAMQGRSELLFLVAFHDIVKAQGSKQAAKVLLKSLSDSDLRKIHAKIFNKGKHTQESLDFLLGFDDNSIIEELLNNYESISTEDVDEIE